MADKPKNAPIDPAVTSLMTCPCGSTWWTLEVCASVNPSSGEVETGLGAFQLLPDGGISSYSGVWVCGDCGEPLEVPKRPSLRAL